MIYQSRLNLAEKSTPYSFACQISTDLQSGGGIGSPKIQNLSCLHILPVLRRLGIAYDFWLHSLFSENLRLDAFCPLLNGS